MQYNHLLIVANPEHITEKSAGSLKDLGLAREIQLTWSLSEALEFLLSDLSWPDAVMTELDLSDTHNMQSDVLIEIRKLFNGPLILLVDASTRSIQEYFRKSADAIVSLKQRVTPDYLREVFAYASTRSNIRTHVGEVIEDSKIIRKITADVTNGVNPGNTTTEEPISGDIRGTLS